MNSILHPWRPAEYGWQSPASTPLEALLRSLLGVLAALVAGVRSIAETKPAISPAQTVAAQRLSAESLVGFTRQSTDNSFAWQIKRLTQNPTADA